MKAQMPSPSPISETVCTLVLLSIITCPECGHATTETMPTDACQYIYDCKQCGGRMKPKKGDCCVYCSHGSVPCPPIQEERMGLGGNGAYCSS